MSRLNIYYGRISYVPKRPGQEEIRERSPIREAIEGATSVERYRHEWVLGNLTFLDDQALVLGRLGYPATEEGTTEDWDEDRHAFVEERERSGVARPRPA